MSNGSAIFKVIASLVWGIGTFIVVHSIKADGAQSGCYVRIIRRVYLKMKMDLVAQKAARVALGM